MRARRSNFIAIVARFGLAGALNTIVGVATVLVLQLGLGADPFVANAVGFAVGISLGFVLNRGFVFRSRDRSLGLALRYGVAVGLAFGLNLVVLALLAGRLQGGFGAAAAQALSMATYTMTLFLAARFWVFLEAGSGRTTAGRLGL